MPNNLLYFELSKNNPEKLLDDFYIFDERNPELDKYIANTKQIKNLLITIKTLQEKKEKPIVIFRYFNELSEIIGKYSNCSEFACFISACDNFVGEVKNNIDLLEQITQKYFLKRELNEIVPEEWIQAILDTNSSRKKGKCGEIKLLHILKQQGYTEVFEWNDFFQIDFCAVKFSKKFDLLSVRRNLDIKIKTKKQNKTLDLIIKAKDKILLCEAKHLNTSGGEQDKQLSELIEIINLKEKNDVSYLAFLDGNYSNILLSDAGGGEKVKAQRRDIKKALKGSPRNYWVNTRGFIQLMSDLKL